eukprot:6190706-Pleurochrysis_carterae.AAC.1
MAGGDGRQRSQGCGPHCRAERLIVVDAVSLSAPLHAQTGFHGAIALALVYSYKADKRASGGQLRTVYQRPTAIGVVVGAPLARRLSSRPRPPLGPAS